MFAILRIARNPKKIMISEPIGMQTHGQTKSWLMYQEDDHGQYNWHYRDDVTGHFDLCGKDPDLALDAHPLADRVSDR
jgi:hypothetical protein